MDMLIGVLPAAYDAHHIALFLTQPSLHWITHSIEWSGLRSLRVCFYVSGSERLMPGALTWA